MNNKQKIAGKENDVAKTVAAAVTGAVVGAGVVAAGMVAMRSDKNKNKAKEIMDELKSKTSAYMKTAQDQVDEGKAKLKQTVAVAKGSKKEVKKIWD